MFEESFIFLPGVQERTERMLWETGIATWDHLLDAAAVKGVSATRLSFWKMRIREAREAMRREDARLALARSLGTRYAWRAYGHLMGEPRYLDIETSERRHDVTVVGVSDGEFYQALVQGRNLTPDALQRALEGASCLVTFNGSSFDLPILARMFPRALPDVPHLDVRHICAQAGLRGGLKRIERRLGISREGPICEYEGADAILLWYRYRFGDDEALRELVDYNAADVLNLRPLLERVVPALWRNVRHGEALAFPPAHRVEET